MEDKIILYTIHCPKCVVLEKKLKDKGIDYSIIEDENYLKLKGIEVLPML